ncbi:MAG: ATP-binding cassette domain-containing protein [Butyrivibrio sp.]|uniref:ABC transporter ATP-binding protein n=1 Tax=Butyrivibrio sp. TaxID=28121 RepID=UPI0025DD6549|nr:ATP-binding cassette domain-containing protein [Butyrivibrio sp.]MCR5770647.1 ATP-binding cassette domain-containing protein [Butyrivibrio sp.]
MLKLSCVNKTFGKGTVNEKKALENINLDVKKGDFISIIGSNGAGKSTLLNAISGVFSVDSGSIILDGTDITRMSEHKRAAVIGRLFQDPMKGSAPSMSIEDNLYLASGSRDWFSHMTGRDRKEFRERLALLGMGLEDRMKHPVGLLSGGQRQALTLLMATYNVPKLLLLDEHTAALDPATAEKVLNITKDVIEKNNITCLMITHNMQSALDLGNRTIMMNDGEIIYDVEGAKRAETTVEDLLQLFKDKAGEKLTNDRMLLRDK